MADVIVQVPSNHPDTGERAEKEDVAPPPPPDFTDPEADVILRSCEGSEFRVFKLILSQASPFFRAMFSLPQELNAEVASSSQLPVIEMVEDASTIEMMLRYCYPLPDPLLTISIRDENQVPQIPELFYVRKALEIARKFDIPRASTNAVRRMSVISEDHPVPIYALACQYDEARLARKAAEHALRHPQDTLLALYPELQQITGEMLRSLLVFHRDCKNVAVAIAQDWSAMSKWRATPYFWFWSGPHGKDVDCPRYSYNHKTGPSEAKCWVQSWWKTYMEDVISTLQTIPDIKRAVTTEGVLEAFLAQVSSKSDTCKICCNVAFKDVKAFVDVFIQKVQEKQSLVHSAEAFAKNFTWADFLDLHSIVMIYLGTSGSEIL
ncbi:hypothetical protein EIP91_010554 [Steccherinum ochraceum]|uniref:BTB domain-containing protein n=1 Tax=Steccherinum ochraceum TaxID=92696 RepID=A0A4R0RCK9_9APHY|nr:hypothetical protein EIP91_010554 [Steccherinum ochraceum]